MDDSEEIYDDEFLDREQDQVEIMEGLEEGEEEKEDNRMELEQSKPPIRTSFRAKLIEILKNLQSAEVKIYSEASKEFIGLLEGHSGGDILREYIQLSPKCSEILESWKLHQGKPGVAHILLLLSAVFNHPAAKLRADGIIIKIHKLAQSILNEKYDDMCGELNSQEHRRQSAALLLLVSIVKLGVGLASEVAGKFESKLPEISKRLSGMQKKRSGGKDAKQGKRRSSTRRAFVRFAMSFIEAGNPRLLRSILQQREMYSGVLRGISGDDVETVVHVLSTLRDKVLIGGSLLPPGLRSVLFGSITLEQLSNISGNPMAGPAADLAHEVLVMVCTDPRNGLMPGMNLKGNEKRLFDLMKKLKVTEAAYHKELLLAIFRSRPSFFAAYMDEFPYNLKPRSSSSWFSAVSLVADMISSINLDKMAVSLTSCSRNGPGVDNPELQNILKCIIPPSFTRSVTSMGLQHSDDLVKHGTLRIVLESLKSLAGLMLAIDSMACKKGDTPVEGAPYPDCLPGVGCLAELEKGLSANEVSCIAADAVETKKLNSLKQFIQDEVRAMLPEPQILLKLLSSSGQKHSKQSGVGSKRRIDLPEVGLKKLKPNDTSEDIDLIISGIDTENSNCNADDLNKFKAESTNKPKAESIVQDLDLKKDDNVVISEIWGLSEEMLIGDEPNSAENLFQSKLLDVFKFYLRTVPLAIEGSFDFFRILPVEPSSLSTFQLQSLLSLLLECIGQGRGGTVSAQPPRFMYRHLQRILNILAYSHVKVIQEHAYVLARAAMISTGAFDQNSSECDTWLFPLSSYSMKSNLAESEGTEAIDHFSSIVSSFLCDAVSTVGNNLFKYLDQTRELISTLDNADDDSPGFSPLIICALEKCLRLLESESRTYKLYEKAMISLYACNTISLILQTQVDTRTLPGVIHLILTEKLNGCPRKGTFCKNDHCEWRPIKNMWCFAQDVLNHGVCSSLPISRSAIKEDDVLFAPVLVKIKELGEHGVNPAGVVAAFSSSIICASPNEILTNFPLLLGVTSQHFRSFLPFLSWVLLLERSFLVNFVDVESELLCSGLNMMEGVIRYSRSDNPRLLRSNALKSLDIGILPDSTKPAASAVLYLYYAPFCVLFSAIMNSGNVQINSSRKLDILHSNIMLDMLRGKLSEGSLDDSISSLRIVLFWANQTMSSFRPCQTLSSNRTEASHNVRLLQMCITLVRYILDHILVVINDAAGLKASGTSSVGHYIQDVIDLIFQQPIVTFSSSQPLCFTNLGNDVQAIVASPEKFHPIDCSILQLLRTVFDFVLSVGKSCNWSSRTGDLSAGLVLSAPRSLVNDFMEKFKLSIMKRDVELLLPRFYMLYFLIRYLSPFESLEVVNWMYSELEGNILEKTSAFVNSTVSVGLHLMDGAFGAIFSYLQKPEMISEFNWLWDRKAGSFDVSILLNLYHKVLEFGMSFRFQCADTCLLKVVTAAYSQRFARPHPDLFPLCIQLSRIMMISPMRLIVYCLYPTSKIKGKILLQLIEASPLHMNLFGKIFLGILSKDLSDLVPLEGGACSDKGNITNKDSKYVFSDDDFVLLLPVALSYLMFIIHKYGKDQAKPLGRILEFYSGILLNGFSAWKNYVSRYIFQEEYDGSLLKSPEDFYDFCRSTLLGKSITMVRYSLILSESRVKDKQLLKIFDSIYSDSSLFDSHVPGPKHYGSCSYKESLNIADVVAAKVSFSRLLVFPSESLMPSLVTQANGKSKRLWSKRMEHAKRFIGILVDAWNDIVRNISLNVDGSNSSCPADCYPIFRFLEHYILSNIVQLSKDIQSYVKESPSVPFLDQFVKSALLHRFEDPITLKSLRCILVALSEAEFSASKILAQLFGDPKFVPTIARSCGYSDSSCFISSGNSLQPIPSILKSLDTSFMGRTNLDSRDICDVSSELQSSSAEDQQIKLELVKLLRVLYYLKGHQHNFGLANVDGMNSRDLLSLFLSGYNATVSEIDLEIHQLMREIETIERLDRGIIADMDYLWGGSAKKHRDELTFDGLISSNKEANSEMIKERRKMFFRENIPVDLKLSITTVLHFCNDKSSRNASVMLERLLEDKLLDKSEKISSSNIKMVQGYDPAFILEFSNHCLAMGYLEPTEFCRIGLLAITFVSISSPDDKLRVLGYECLGKFVEALEKYQNRPLQLLLTHIQNGITKQWQRIPSVIAIFAAEASLVLLEPSQNHFFTLNEFLMRSKTMDMEVIPLFPDLFGSGSIHFKADRLWILHLLYAGLNSDLDAEIYIKQKVPGFLLSFNSSLLADHGSKVLILQIMKKCLKLPNIALCLIKQHGLISWFSSTILFYGERLYGDHDKFSLAVVEFVLEALNDGICSGAIREWLQEHALEQLLDLSSHLHTLIVSSLKLFKGNVSLVNSLSRFMVTAWKLSQDRSLKMSRDKNTYQPGFTLSLVGLSRLYQAVDLDISGLASSAASGTGLNVILMSAPIPAITHTDRAILSKLTRLAVPAALQPSFKQRFPANDPDPYLIMSWKEGQGEESLVSRLLRWVSASIILGSIADKSSKMSEVFSRRPVNETLQPILEVIIKKEGESWNKYFSSREELAIIMLYLQQLLGRNCSFLPSVILAICLLLLGDSPNSPVGTVCTALDGISDAVASHCSKIYCPPEVNPDWRWSYDKPWPWEDEDCKPARTAREQMEEEQACRSILLMFSNAVGQKSLDASALSYKDVESFGLYDWERDTFLRS